jgi:hypothetical protein
MMQSRPIGNGALTARLPREMAALMDALQIHGACTDLLAELNDAEWERLLAISDRAHLTLALAQLPTARFPAWVTDRLQKNLHDNAARFERIQAIYREAAAALDHAGVPHVVLKGFTHAPDYVMDPRYRMQGDLDLYCDPQHTPMAVKALESIGYEPIAETDFRLADHAPSMVRPQNWVWRGNMYDAAMPLSIEIHFCLWNERLLLIPLPEAARFWDRRVVRMLGDFSFACLSPVDQLGYTALHIMRNVLLGQGIVHLTHELATFLDRRAEDEHFWAEWVATHSAPMRNIEAIAFSLASMWFSCDCHATVRAQIDSLPLMQQVWLESFGGCPLEEMFRRTKEGSLLHLMLAESRAYRRRVLRGTILPRIIPKPASCAVRALHRKPEKRSRRKLRAEYLLYLSYRLLINGSAVARFMWNGLRLFLARGRRLSGHEHALPAEGLARRSAIANR